MDESPTSAIRRSIDAVAQDEQRRSEILKKLKSGIKLYLASCSRERDVQWDRVNELLGAACRGFYDSLAASFIAIEPPVDPQRLFDINGDLFGGRTLVEFAKAVQGIKIRRPDHWPPLQMWRDDDSTEARRTFAELSKTLNKYMGLGPQMEDGCLNERVAEGVTHWRPQFERRFRGAQQTRAMSHGIAPKSSLPKVKRKADPAVTRIKSRVRELVKLGLSHQEICNRLAGTERPPRATWREVSWPIAYRRHPGAVSKWLSEALR